MVVVEAGMRAVAGLPVVGTLFRVADSTAAMEAGMAAATAGGFTDAAVTGEGAGVGALG
jgi:hypothetical protein